MLRVLIADDEEKICLLISNLVNWKALGYEIIGMVHDGEDAMSFIKEHHPDVVISDIRMPGMDGIELITQTKALYPDICFIIISGYSQFRYAQQALKQGAEDYLLKPIREEELLHILRQVREQHDLAYSRQEELTSLRSEIGRSRTRIREHLLYEMLLPENRNRAYSTEEINAECGTRFKRNWCLVILRIFLSEDNTDTSLSSLLLSKIQVLAAERFEGFPNEVLIAARGSELLFLLDVEASQQSSVANLFSMLRSEALALCSGITAFTILLSSSRCVPDPVCVYTLYRDALRAMDMRMLSSGDFFFADRTPPVPETIPVPCLTDSDRKEIELSFRHLDPDHFRQNLDTIGPDYLKHMKIPEDVHRCFQELTLHLMNCAAAAFPGSEFPDENAFTALFDSSPNASALLKRLNTAVCSCLEKARLEKSSNNNISVKNAEYYINQHLAEQLRLETIAEQLGYNPSYFSILFKKETGRNFSDYITELRIEKAQQLLSHSSRSILEISADVGYCDSKHFAKTFRKITGLSPRQYRKLYS